MAGAVSVLFSILNYSSTLNPQHLANPWLIVGVCWIAVKLWKRTFVSTNRWANRRGASPTSSTVSLFFFLNELKHIKGAPTLPTGEPAAGTKLTATYLPDGRCVRTRAPGVPSPLARAARLPQMFSVRTPNIVSLNPTEEMTKILNSEPWGRRQSTWEGWYGSRLGRQRAWRLKMVRNL